MQDCKLDKTLPTEEFYNSKMTEVLIVIIILLHVLLSYYFTGPVSYMYIFSYNFVLPMNLNRTLLGYTSCKSNFT